MKFDKFEVEVMAAFLEEAHGRHLVQRQIDLAEQLGLGKALFQEFRKELEVMLDLFHSFDDSNSGVLKKVEVWVALSNLGLLPHMNQNKVVMLVMISTACADAAPGRHDTRHAHVAHVARDRSNVPRNSQRWLGTKAALKALLQSSEFLQLSSQVGSLDEGCMDFAHFLYLVHSVRQMQSRSLREDLAPIFDRMLRRRKKAGTAVISAVGVPEVSQALELLHMGPKQREDQLKITEFLNEVNEFGFTPLTLDFEAFVRFIRQVKEWQATCMRAEDRAYGVELGLQERMVDEFRVIFDIIDNTGSGELDLLGVKRACGLLGQKSLSFEELRKIFEQLDKDGSGAIDFREFLHLGREMECRGGHMTNMANLGKQKGRSNPLGANAAIFSPFGWAQEVEAAFFFGSGATGRVTWEPPPLREESPTSQNSQISQADLDLALSALSALIHDNEVLSSRITNYEAALNGVLNEVQNYREQAAALATSKVQTKQLIACLTDAADQREELLRQRASSCLRIHELMDIIHDSLESLGDENHSLWQMVRLAQNAANSPAPAPGMLESEDVRFGRCPDLKM
ncbi:unnamed protein product [Cladocopium goreaui]|uniref:EF-hand domain-containing protein n=1 Tax=Cladocopium goreaui TaxID=2562237 RepID=A0A9P1G045_9DINO|nr:unnamed protein product [Cladocopium goreaui]